MCYRDGHPAMAHDNRSPGQDGGGFDIDGETQNAILQYNLSCNNEGPGFFLCQYPQASPLKNNIIRYNISQNDGRKNNRRSAVDIFAAEPNASGCEIYYNTVYTEVGAAIGFGGYPIPGVVIRNNIFVTGQSPIVGDYSHARFERNVWWTLGSHDFIVGEFDSFDAWYAATGKDETSNTVLNRFADPRLSQVGEARVRDPHRLSRMTAYRLLPGSPCLCAGSPIPNNGERDFWGVAVTGEQRPSIGACQNASSHSEVKEQTPGDVSTQSGEAE